VSTTVLVTALRLETRAVLAALTRPRRVRPAVRPTWAARAGAHVVTVVEGGVGPDAARAATAALPAGAAVLGSVGFVGALAPDLVAGDIVVAEAIVWDERGSVRRHVVAPVLVEALVGALTPASPRPPRAGAILSSPTVLAGVGAKRAAYDRHAAVAVEMESAALAAHAAARGTLFFALRVVLDPADLSLEGLPPELAVSWAARARVAAMPSVWPLLGTLRRHAATASTALTRALRTVLPALGDR
jgi:adenosylhomocysteine nucleosidase